tara:strand:- start:367 stop:588 length:222 start_codon:yes stop_codon:yes gene_type:complete
MRRTGKKRLNLNQSSPREYDLNKSSTGCAPCSKEAFKIERKINNRKLSEIKIEEIKSIARSIFQSDKYDSKKS